MRLKDIEARLWEMVFLSIREGAPGTTEGLRRLISDVQRKSFPTAKALARRALKRQLRALKKIR